MLRIVGLCGSPSSPSRTKALVQSLVEEISSRTNLPSILIDVADFVSDLGVSARGQASPRLEQALKEIETATLLIVGTPIYKGSYTGLFKHMIDLLDYPVLLGTPVGLLATGGSDRHALAIEYQLRPLFGFFGARTLPTGVFVSERDIVDGQIAEPGVRQRLDQLLTEALDAVQNAQRQPGGNP